MSFWKIGYRKKNRKIFEFDYDQYENYEEAREAFNEKYYVSESLAEMKIFFVSECSEEIPE